MKIRRDAVAVSSVLFTIALLMMAPVMWWNAMTGWESNPFDSGELYRAFDRYAPSGFASLAVIAIGLIVAWMGYIRLVRWTWFVMFLIVWAWYFPLFMLMNPSLMNASGWRHIDIIETLATAIRESGLSRSFVEECVAFVLMVLALVLPLKAFTLRRGSGSGGSGCANSGAPKEPEI